MGLEPDLLVHWLERTRGASPLQYLFMGSGGTNSKLHVDPGGLDLVIAPLVGWKEVTLVHREDAELVGAMCDDDALGDAGGGSSDDESAAARAGQESEIPNFKGSFLGRFPLVSADFWTSDHLSERSRGVNAFLGTSARGTLTLKRR